MEADSLNEILPAISFVEQDVRRIDHAEPAALERGRVDSTAAMPTSARSFLDRNRTTR